MSHRLLLAIDEQWPARPDCPWVLLGPDGQPTAEGHSEPRHWPAAAECEVVLTGPQCLWLEVPLPRAKRSDLPRLLAYALEDRLLKDPDTQHLTVSHRRPAGDGERELTGGKGADSAIEALGLQSTFEQAMRCIKPGGTLSSLGVYSEDLKIPLSAFAAGLGDHKINTALCPGGKERMRRLMNVLASNRLDLGLLVTHQYKLDDIVAAYDLFAHQRDGVLKVAIKPQ